MAESRIHPVLMSGGAGSRLWPLSREARPKQLLRLTGERTLLQEAALRGSDPELFAPLITVANLHHRFAVAEQLAELGVPFTKPILEPVARNTAAAVAVAALAAGRDDPDALILVMPADHVVSDPDSFLAAVRAGEAAARRGELVLFGVRPTAPATGYGYIHAGEALEGAPGVQRVRAFVEKPGAETAERYVSGGEHLWNAGIFLLPVRTVLAELEAHAPEVLAASRAALAAAQEDDDFVRLDEAALLRSPSISIDHALFEKTARTAVAPVSCGWTDVGSWSALWELGAETERDNVVVGDVVAEKTSGSYLRSEGPLVATVGVEDLIVIATPDAVLVAHKGHDQEVKTIVERLRALNHDTVASAG